MNYLKFINQLTSTNIEESKIDFYKEKIQKVKKNS